MTPEQQHYYNKGRYEGFLDGSKAGIDRVTEIVTKGYKPVEISIDRTTANDILVEENQKLKEIISEVHSWIVCSAIADADDMMDNAERIEEITNPEYRS